MIKYPDEFIVTQKHIDSRIPLPTFGRFIQSDIGKKVKKINDIYYMENEDQKKHRLNKEFTNDINC